MHWKVVKRSDVAGLVVLSLQLRVRSKDVMVTLI
jgi:hypothetical protein